MNNLLWATVGIALVATAALMPALTRIRNPELRKWVRRLIWISFIIGWGALACFLFTVPMRELPV